MEDYCSLEKDRVYNFLLNLPDSLKKLSDSNLQMVFHMTIMELKERGYTVKWEIDKNDKKGEV
ncbi:MAG: hypothetical protein AABY79_05095 [Nitrospirota bacterium]